jgi:hypothetical protein
VTPTCFTPCQSPVGCPVPTPTYDQFVTWGLSAATYPTLSSTSFAAEAAEIAGGLAMVGAVVGGLGAAAVLSVVVPTATLEAVAESMYPLMAAEMTSGVDGTLALAPEALSAIGFIFAVVVFAIVTSVLEGIRVATNAQLPLKLAQLVVGARTVTADPATLLADTTGQSTLFSLFVGATMPAPRVDSNCDWESTVPTGQLIGTYSPLGEGPDTTALNRGCLNPPAIPAASPTDPHFMVTQQGGATTASPSIGVTNVAAGASSTVRLSGHWFVQQVSHGGVNNVQSLRLNYTDWAGAPQRAILLHDSTGYFFVGISTPLGGDASSIDPATCAADGTCWKSDHIQYVGSDGKKYSASVQDPVVANGTPISPAHVLEGTPATFNANNFAPVGADHELIYTWRFRKTGCGITFNEGCPNFEPPISGPAQTATFTWQSPGPGAVQLTADDRDGHSVTTTFPVNVENIAPTVHVTRDCATDGPPCDVRVVDAGQPLTLTGVAADAGDNDDENIVVYWGDGTTSHSAAGPETIVFNPTMTLTQDGAKIDGAKTFTFSGSHTYAQPGVYFATASMSDWFGGTGVSSFTVTVPQRAQVAFGALDDQVYGGQLHLTAQGAFGPVVDFAASPASVCTTSGANGADLKMVGVGQCTVTASQSGSLSAQQTFRVKPAPLQIKADDQSSAYGAPAPTYTASFAGLVNGDTKDVVTGLVLTGPGGSKAVGTYPIVPSGATSPNYDISFVNGTETVTPAPLTVTADDQTKVYGGPDPAFTVSYAGLVNGDTQADITGVTASGPPTGSGVGQYPITVSGGTNANYAITTVNGKETIKAAPLKITARDATKAYGAPNPAFTATYDGLVNGDGSGVVTGLTLTGPPATSGVGSYPIHPSGASSPNYAITYVDGHETITPSMLVIKADAKTVASGNVASYTWAGVGWVNGDNDATLSRSPNHVPTCSAIVNGAAASASTPPGVYANAITCQGAVDANYTITYAPASLTVDPVITLAQTGLPTNVAAKATLDGVSVVLPVTRREVGYNTAHSYSFPSTVIGPDGTIYTTATPAFSGSVTSNASATASYATMNGLVDAAVKSGGMPKALGTALDVVWTKAQTDLKAGKIPAAKVDIAAFAALVVAGRIANKITAATATLLLQRAQAVFASIGGQGTVSR